MLPSWPMCTKYNQVVGNSNLDFCFKSHCIETDHVWYEYSTTPVSLKQTKILADNCETWNRRGAAHLTYIHITRWGLRLVCNATAVALALQNQTRKPTTRSACCNQQSKSKMLLFKFENAEPDEESHHQISLLQSARQLKWAFQIRASVNVFSQVVELSCEMYLSKLLNIFVQTVKCISPNY